MQDHQQKHVSAGLTAHLPGFQNGGDDWKHSIFSRERRKLIPTNAPPHSQPVILLLPSSHRNQAARSNKSTPAQHTQARLQRMNKPRRPPHGANCRGLWLGAWFDRAAQELLFLAESG
jgi:hypothetical protein